MSEKTHSKKTQKKRRLFLLIFTTGNHEILLKMGNLICYLPSSLDDLSRIIYIYHKIVLHLKFSVFNAFRDCFGKAHCFKDVLNYLGSKISECKVFGWRLTRLFYSKIIGRNNFSWIESVFCLLWECLPYGLHRTIFFSGSRQPG